MSSTLPPSPSPDPPPTPKGEGRPSNRQKQGQRSWHRQLIASGRLEEAAAWARACNLLPPAEPPAGFGLRPPSAATHPAPAPRGGEGVSQAGGPENGHTSTPIGQILQCELDAEASGPVDLGLQIQLVAMAAGPAVAAEAHLSLPADSLALIVASPKGEVEGVEAGRQAGSSSGADTEEVKVEECLGGWPLEAEGVVGIRCRNKWYVEVQVGEKKWAKAEIGGRVLTYAEKRMVRRVWVSADGRDAEYEFVSPALEIRPVEPEPVIEPVAVPEPVVVAEEPAAGPDYNPSATDFMEQARNAAYAAYSR